MYRRAPVVSSLLIAATLACCEGLTPPSEPPPVGTMAGVITYSNWDSAGALHDLRLVGFRSFPPTNLRDEVLAGRVFIYPPLPALTDTTHLPYYVDSTGYTAQILAGTWQYIVVAQQFGPVRLEDWRPVGQYDLDTNLVVPSPITIMANETTWNVNIHVDFANLPPSPLR